MAKKAVPDPSQTGNQASPEADVSAASVSSIDIGKRIQDLLEEHHMSKYRLSKLTGIDQTALANNISGKHIPTISNVERICDALGITLSEFFASGN